MHSRDKARYLRSIANWELSDLNPPGMAPPNMPEDPEVQELSARQYAIYEFMRSLVDTFGKFDQDLGVDNARYLSESQNPFAAQHIQCSTCAYYNSGGCDLVTGNIEPGGLCQYNLSPAHTILEEIQQAEGIKPSTPKAASPSY